MNKERRYKEIEEIMDTKDLSDTEFTLLNNELNQLHDEIFDYRRRNEEAKAERERIRREEIAVLQSLIKEGKMQQVVDEYGQEFIGDYTITDNFQVLSFAFNERNPNQQKVWQCYSHEEAVAKLHQLLYWRVYDHYMRDKNGT